MKSVKWYLRTPDETFGPVSGEELLEWAKRGRIHPGQEVSDDNLVWTKVEEVPFLDMRFSIDIGDGNPRGPFNKSAAEALLASGRLPSVAKIVEVREPFVEKVKEVRVEVPIEKIVEVPVEKIVERVVVDDTRVKELEGLLAEERRHSADLQARGDAASKSASELRTELDVIAATSNELKQRLENAERTATMAAKESSEREAKLSEQIKTLEVELRRLPQAASEVADIQAAMYSIMTKEAEELRVMLEAEKQEFEAAKERYAVRSDKLLERRRELLKRSGANVGEMTHKALIERPEDPRTSLLRKELEETRRNAETISQERERKIRELEKRLEEREMASRRMLSTEKDVTQLQLEVQELREKLQLREKELTAERERTESLRQQQAISQQALMTRIASLESTSIGTVNSLSTNQSREAKLIKLPGWMHLGK